MSTLTCDQHARKFPFNASFGELGASKPAAEISDENRHSGRNFSIFQSRLCKHFDWRLIAFGLLLIIPTVCEAATQIGISGVFTDDYVQDATAQDGWQVTQKSTNDSVVFDRLFASVQHAPVQYWGVFSGDDDTIQVATPYFLDRDFECPFSANIRVSYNPIVCGLGSTDSVQLRISTVVQHQLAGDTTAGSACYNDSLLNTELDSLNNGAGCGWYCNDDGSSWREFAMAVDTGVAVAANVKFRVGFRFQQNFYTDGQALTNISVTCLETTAQPTNQPTMAPTNFVSPYYGSTDPSLNQTDISTAWDDYLMEICVNSSDAINSIAVRSKNGVEHGPYGGPDGSGPHCEEPAFGACFTGYRIRADGGPNGSIIALGMTSGDGVEHPMYGGTDGTLYTWAADTANVCLKKLNIFLGRNRDRLRRLRFQFDEVELPPTLTPTTASPTTASPTTSDPTTANPTTSEPTTSDPTTATPTTAEPTTSEPNTSTPTTATSDPTTAAPTTATPTTSAPTTAEPTTSDPATSQPTTSDPTTAQPTSATPTTATPTTADPTTAEPTTSEPTTAEPTTIEPTTAQPTTSEPTDNPSTVTVSPTARPSISPTTVTSSPTRHVSISPSSLCYNATFQRDMTRSVATNQSDVLWANESLVSENCQYLLLLHADGNLALYGLNSSSDDDDNNSQTRRRLLQPSSSWENGWETDTEIASTAGIPQLAIVDGRLVVYEFPSAQNVTAGTGIQLWTSVQVRDQEVNEMTLTLSDDGCLALTNEETNVTIWGACGAFSGAAGGQGQGVLESGCSHRVSGFVLTPVIILSIINVVVFLFALWTANLARLRQEKDIRSRDSWSIKNFGPIAYIVIVIEVVTLIVFFAFAWSLLWRSCSLGYTYVYSFLVVCCLLFGSVAIAIKVLLLLYTHCAPDDIQVTLKEIISHQLETQTPADDYPQHDLAAPETQTAAAQGGSVEMENVISTGGTEVAGEENLSVTHHDNGKEELGDVDAGIVPKDVSDAFTAAVPVDRYDEDANKAAQSVIAHVDSDLELTTETRSSQQQQAQDQLRETTQMPVASDDDESELKTDAEDDENADDTDMDSAFETEPDEDDTELQDAAKLSLLQSETRDNLMQCELPKEVSAVLGDRKKFKAPKKKAAKAALERDLRKLTMALQDLDEDQRKYAKLSVLKFYDLLFEVFRRYCKIGGDKHWLTQKGWNALIEDSFVADKKSETCSDKACQELFNQVYYAHHSSASSSAASRRLLRTMTTALSLAEWSDDDPWSGVWKQDTEDTGGGAAEEYRLKQTGDRKLVGFIKDFNFCDLNGSLRASDRSTAELMVHWHEGARQGKRRLYKATLIKPENPNDPVRMSVAWKSVAASTNVDTGIFEEGVYTMTKFGALSDADKSGFAFQIGLARHEYFDAMLMLAKMKYPALSDKRFAALCTLSEQHLIPFLFGCMEEAKEASIKALFRPHSTELHKLFGVFKEGLIGLPEWRVLCADVLKQDKNAFAKGGQPSKSDIDAAFELAKDANDLQLTYKAFELALRNLAQRMYKKKPKMKYAALAEADKIKKLLKWAVKLQKSGYTPN